MIMSLKQKKIKFKPPSEIFMLTHSIDHRLQSENSRFKTSRKLTNNTNFWSFDSGPLKYKSAIFLCFRVIKLSFFCSYVEFRK